MHSGQIQSVPSALPSTPALGDYAEAENCLLKASQLVNTVKMTSAEKANYLMTMANLCEVHVQLKDGKAGGT